MCVSLPLLQVRNYYGCQALCAPLTIAHPTREVRAHTICVK